MKKRADKYRPEVGRTEENNISIQHVGKHTHTHLKDD